MSMQSRIEEKLTHSLAPERLALDNESHQHKVAKGAETHFNLIIVAAAFEGMSRVQRQRRVYAILDEELRQEGGVHALTMKALTPAEWEAAGGEVTNPAPRCMGGSRHRG